MSITADLSDGKAGDKVTDGTFKGVLNNDKTVTVTGFVSNPKKGDIVIPASIAGKKVTKIGENAFSGSKLAGRLTIPKSVTKI